MSNADASQEPRKPALLCLSQSFTPQTTPTAIRAGKLVQGLGLGWDVTVLTESRQPDAGQPDEGEPVHVRVVASRRPQRLLAALRRLRLQKLIELLVWPDEAIFWVLPAIRAGRRSIRECRPQAIVVFMMPYSAGLAGVLLARLTGLPLILNLDDSLTCTDMHPRFPTRLHYRLAKALEDLYARRADAVVYVSQRNLDAVRTRQPARVRRKLELVRYGVDPADFRPPGIAGAADGNGPPSNRPAGDGPAENGSFGDGPAAGLGTGFEIAYVGAMSGWWALIGDRPATSPLKRVYGAWNRFGRYERTVLDNRTSSPAIAGGAILDVLAEHPEWDGRVKLMVYGNPYDPSVVMRALARAGVEQVVEVSGPVPHALVPELVWGADLLFIALPDRVDGSPGGRISAKTYEYLITDRPILAAVPYGENWDYLADKPGVWLVQPGDRAGMRAVIEELVQAKFAGEALAFDRTHLHGQLSYRTRTDEFAAVIRRAIARRAGR